MESLSRQHWDDYLYNYYVFTSYIILFTLLVYTICYIQLLWIISNYTIFNSPTCYITINRTISVWIIV